MHENEQPRCYRLPSQMGASIIRQMRPQVYQSWRERQAERAAAAKKPSASEGGGAGANGPAAPARLPGVTEAFYVKLTAALEVKHGCCIKSPMVRLNPDLLSQESRRIRVSIKSCS